MFQVTWRRSRKEISSCWNNHCCSPGYHFPVCLPVDQGQPEEQEDLQSTRVHFSNNQADPLYSNIRAARPLRHMEQQEFIEYAAVSFNRASTAPRTRDFCSLFTYSDLQLQVSRLLVYESYNWVDLKCHSSCRLPDHLHYVWYKNGQKTWRRTSSFSVSVYPTDSYSCAVEGYEKFPSPPVYVPKLPSVSVSPSGEIVEGSSVTLTCSSDANPAASYTWYKENGKRYLQPLSKEPQLVLRSIQSSDSGEYYCTAENKLGKKTSTHISINVKYAPRVPSVSVSPSGEIVEGSSVNLTCSSDANPAANYTWYKENQTLFQGTEGIHHFTSISSEDRGIYHCSSENQYGQIMSPPLSVDVQYAPRVPSVSVSPSGEIVEGSSVTLTCSSDANPAANYTWYKENEDLPKASGQIFTIRPEHSGNYYCEAQNRRGRHNSTLHLIVVAGAGGKLAAAGTITVVLLAIISLSVFLWIRKKRASKEPSDPEERADNREQLRIGQPEEQEDLQYASIRFSTKQADPLYSNIRAARPSDTWSNKRSLSTLLSALTGPVLPREPEVRKLERIQLHCTAQSTEPDEHSSHYIYSLIFPCVLIKFVFKQVTIDFI
ncbi:B-cell receptor CD22-like [Dicentrarchus labrax]|uniref:B-cell receptor CD22-like n=1 Tax=Dicentrarchus labrax TaxID=13489 RepID=UPI0021F61ED8|nr:B-cell receptor CD22-like [Dicentrarchus labrax]